MENYINDSLSRVTVYNSNLNYILLYYCTIRTSDSTIVAYVTVITCTNTE